MLRTLRVGLLLALAVIAIPMRTVAAQDHAQSSVSAVSASPEMPAPSPDTLPFNLMALAVVGATTLPSRKMNLSKAYLWTDGQTYGPGANVEVPEGFPELDDKGDVIHPPGSNAERNQRSTRRMQGSAPNTGGVNTGEGNGPAGTGASVSGKTSAELEAMDKAALMELADQYPDVTVERLDDSGEVEDGEPLKRDYVRALGATATK